MTNKTVTMPLELAERLSHVLYMHDAENTEAASELDSLIAAPAVERQVEPVTMDGKTTIREYAANTIDEKFIGDDWTKGYEECKRRIHTMLMQPINTSPPAPVAVVLPDYWQDQLLAEMERRFDLRKHIDDDHMVNDDTQIGVEFARDWIAACLDKVKELNQ